MTLFVGGIGTALSWYFHTGPWRWLSELQAKLFFGSYGIVLNFALILLVTHLAVSTVLATFGMPPAAFHRRQPLRQMGEWYMTGRWSFYGFVLGLTFVAMGGWIWGKAAMAGDLVLANAGRVPASAAWVYLDGEPLWDQAVKKKYATYVPYVDPKNKEAPGVIVSSGGDLGLQRMQQAHARGVGIEVLEAWDGIPPDVRAYFVEHDLSWGGTAKGFDFGHSPVKQGQNGRMFFALGLILAGLGWWRRPRLGGR